MWRSHSWSERCAATRSGCKCLAPAARPDEELIGYGGAISIVAGLTAASGLWVLVDMPAARSEPSQWRRLTRVHVARTHRRCVGVAFDRAAGPEPPLAARARCATGVWH